MLSCTNAYSKNLAKEWNDVKDSLDNYQNAIADVATASQTLYDAMVDYEMGRTDYGPVARARQSLAKAKSKLYNAQMKYSFETNQFEMNVLYQNDFHPYVGKNPYTSHQVIPSAAFQADQE